MPKTKFRYNIKELRYERVKISFFHVLFAGVSYIAFGILFFIGLLFLQNYILETPREKALREENKALSEYQVMLTKQLATTEQELANVEKEADRLYEKLFEAKMITSEQSAVSEKEEILIGSSSDFDKWASALSKTSAELNQKAAISNIVYGSAASVKKTDFTKLLSVPSLPPVQEFKVEQLVSGYGTRINPFHKGKYHHDGVDIAAPHGTPIVAASNGVVQMASRSELVAGYGNYVEINHGNGIITRYAHMGEIKIRPGQKITKGQVIGTVGSSGGSIAPHVHYEVVKNDQTLNPVKFFVEKLDAREYQRLQEVNKIQNQSLD